jgi:hypothetical protein
MNCCEREERRLKWTLRGEAAVTLLAFAGIWTDGQTATAGKFAWSAVIGLVALAAAVLTDRYLDRL